MGYAEISGEEQFNTARLSSRKLSGGLETRPSTRLQGQPYLYSVKHTPTSISDLLHRVDIDNGSSASVALAPSILGFQLPLRST